MKIAIIGATGFVGSAILNELASRNQDITAIARTPKDTSNATWKSADIFNVDALAEILKGHDAVINAYNPGWTNPNIYNETLSVYRAILAGAKKAGVKRLLCVGGAGTLFCAPGLRLVDAGVLPAEIMPGVKSLGEFYLNILCNEKEIDWVFFSPAGNLAPGERTGKFRLGKDDLIVNDKGESRISVEDYAVAMIDEAENKSHHKERFTIGY